MKFWYRFDGTYNDSTLNIYKRPGDGEPVEKPPFWTMKGVKDNWWLIGEAPIESDRPFALVFEALATSGASVVSLDDISRVNECSSDLLNCDFEAGSCLWINYPMEDFQWVLQRGREIFGPTADHTTNTPYGKFMILEDYSNTEVDVNSILKSTYFKINYYCLSFFYWTEGGSELNLSISEYDTEDIVKVLWYPDDPKDESWNNARVSVDYKALNISSDSIVQLLFVGTLPTGSKDISYKAVALDDITYTEGVCSEKTTTTEDPCAIHCDGKCVTSDQICDFVNDCSGGEDEPLNCGFNCSFEAESEAQEETCGFIADNQGIWTWSWEQAGPNFEFGPPQDHTYEEDDRKGHYIVVENNEIEGDNPEALLTSPYIRFAFSSCKIRYWYFINSPENVTRTAQAELRTYMNYSTEESCLLDKQRGNQGYSWKENILCIGKFDKQFTINFEAHLSDETETQIAIDDILFEDCALPPTSDPSNCNTTKNFVCTRHTCISQDLLCDYNDDCGDNSDESLITAYCDQYAGRCDFEDGNCDWTPLANGNSTNFVVGQGETETEGTGPTKDHTTNRPSGKYLYIDATNQQIAQIKSPIVYYDPNYVNPTGGKRLPCFFRFHYLMYGEDIDKLTVFSRSYDGEPWKEEWSHEGSIGLCWERQTIFVKNQEHIQFMIQATANKTGDKGDIAIDDVSFTSSCIPYGGDLPPYVSTTTEQSPCESNEFLCSSGKCILQETVCDFKPDCPDGDDEYMCAECSFDLDDHGTCGWEDKSTGRYFWEMTDGHEFPDSSGWVMAVKFGEGEGVDFAQVTTVPLGPVPDTCEVHFRYMKKGGDNGKSKLILSVDGDELWKMIEDAGSKWHQQTVSTSNRERGWTLSMIGMYDKPNGTLLFDDVHFVNCTMPDPNECKENQFKCDNGDCVSKNQLCDFANDCTDWSDESSCESYPDRCDFQNDFCFYSQDDTDDFDWMRKSGSTIDAGRQ